MRTRSRKLEHNLKDDWYIPKYLISFNLSYGTPFCSYLLWKALNGHDK